MSNYQMSLNYFLGVAGIFGFVNSVSAQNPTVYVISSGFVQETEDGTSWSTAFNQPDALQKGIDSAIALSNKGTTRVEIWVKGGLYKPSKPVAGDARARTFKLPNNVHIYGSFAGGESLRSQRVVGCVGGMHSGRPCTVSADCPGGTCSNTNPSILSGDIQTVGIHSDNTYHVTTYDKPNGISVLDGFMVQHGYANGTVDATHKDNQGGAVQIRKVDQVCIAGGPRIENCVFRNNFASDHSAVNDHALATVINNCTFENNTANGHGAGLLVEHGSPTVTNCTFSNNNATEEGGGLWIGHRTDPTCTGSSAATVENCMFVGNSSIQGGGAWAKDTATTFRDCTFDGNAATSQGGGLWIGNDSPGSSQANVESCLFIANSSIRGGGAYIQDPISPTFTDCSFSSNEALNGDGGSYGGGGGMWTDGANPTLENCEFNGNSTNGQYSFGGGIYALGGTPIINNCRFENNDSGIGGAIWEQGSSILATNTLFLHNSAGDGAAVYSIVIGFEGQSEYRSCKFIGNGPGSGTATLTSGTVVNFINSVFVGNTSTSAVQQLGGVATMINCTVAHNDGVGIIANYVNNMTVKNCIVWGNEDQIYYTTGTPNVTYSDVQDSTECNSPVFPGLGNIDKNPLFVDVDGQDNILGTEDDDVHLRLFFGVCNNQLFNGSPCIDAGSNAAAEGLATDIDGEARVVDQGWVPPASAIVDMGADEVQP